MDDPDHRATVIAATAEAVAAILAPDDAAILPPLIRAGEMVWAMARHEAGPPRALVRAELLRIAHAADELFEALDSEAGRWTLRDQGVSSFDAQTNFLRDLALIGVRAHNHALELARGGTDLMDGPKLRGERKDAISPPVACAGAIREIWEAAHGKLPTNTNAIAADACEGLWAGLGLRRGGAGWGEHRVGWRRHLSQASRLPDTFKNALYQRLFLKRRSDS